MRVRAVFDSFIFSRAVDGRDNLIFSLLFVKDNDYMNGCGLQLLKHLDCHYNLHKTYPITLIQCVSGTICFLIFNVIID